MCSFLVFSAINPTKNEEIKSKQTKFIFQIKNEQYTSPHSQAGFQKPYH